jgi:hypothetical protein
MELLTAERHEALMKELGTLPFGQVDGRKKELEELFLKYNSQARELFETIRAYNRVAAAVGLGSPPSADNVGPGRRGLGCAEEEDKLG